MTALPSLSWVSAAALLLGVGCGSPGAAPYSKAETDAALAPARDLRARCYAGSQLERAGQSAVLDYELSVVADGSVRSLPVHVDPDNPALVECVRLRLNQLRFPAKGWDRLTLHFELKPELAADELRVSSP
jgi:hypothetical protein